MKKLLQNLCVLLMLALALPSFADDCVMHIRTKADKTVEVTVTEGSFTSATWSTYTENPEFHFFAYTGYCTTDADGKPTFEDEQGNVTGTLLCDMLFADIEEITFSGLSEVKELEAKDADIRICDGVVKISGVTAPVHVTVANISGMLEYDGVVKTDTEIDLKRLGNGIHTVKAGNVTFKTLTR